MKKLILLLLVVTLVVPGTVFAQPKGKGAKGPGGAGRPKGHAATAEDVAEKVGKETVEVVAEEMLKKEKPSPSGTGRPPGLSKKEKMPPGLEKQGKTPPGWEKGRKEGWDKTADTQEGSAIRRMIRRAFQKSKESSQADKKE